MKWSTPPERSRGSITFLLAAVICLLAFQDVIASPQVQKKPIKCELIDIEISEIIETAHLEQNQVVKWKNKATTQNFPKELFFTLQRQDDQVLISENLIVKKKILQTERQIQTKYSDYGYMIECEKRKIVALPVAQVQN